MTENITDTSTPTDTPETVPAFILELDEEREEFLAYEDMNEWALAEHAAALEAGEFIEIAKSTRNLALAHLLPEEHARFNTFMRRHGRNPDIGNKIQDALVALWQGETNIPKAQPSSDSSTSTASIDSTLTEPSSSQESDQENETQTDGSSTQD